MTTCVVCARECSCVYRRPVKGTHALACAICAGSECLYCERDVTRPKEPTMKHHNYTTPSPPAPSTVAYTFVLRDPEKPSATGVTQERRHVTLYAAPGKLFEMLAQVTKEFEVTKADVLEAKEHAPGKKVPSDE